MALSMIFFIFSTGILLAKYIASFINLYIELLTYLFTVTETVLYLLTTFANPGYATDKKANKKIISLPH